MRQHEYSAAATLLNHLLHRQYADPARGICSQIMPQNGLS
jgi:hypothetical protein